MKKIIKTIAIVAFVLASIAGIWAYRAVMADNIQNDPSGSHVLYISTDWNYDSLKIHLYPILKNQTTFNQVALKMNLPNKVIAGMYKIDNDMGNRKLIQKLRSGQFEQVKILFKSSTTRAEILSQLGNTLQPDSSDFKNYLDTSVTLKNLGYNAETWPCLMMANTYYFNWATTPAGVIKRFLDEKNKFWTEDKIAKASKLGLSVNEAIILASIVDAETMKETELKKIAGVYLNRLQKDWPLQADPTVKYIALKEGRRRVLYSDLKVADPYNTYIYKGLPPGPVILPSVNAVDAVLNAESHDYMFFCAKDDFSGYHLFTTSLDEHNKNAAKYHKALDARGITE